MCHDLNLNKIETPTKIGFRLYRPKIGRMVHMGDFLFSVEKEDEKFGDKPNVSNVYNNISKFRFRQTGMESYRQSVCNTMRFMV